MKQILATPGKSEGSLPSIYVAGHRGMVGSALVRALEAREEKYPIISVDRADLDLMDQAATAAFLRNERPDIVIVAAARVGGIEANRTFPAEFLHENLSIISNLVHGAFEAGVSRLLFLGSSCIYPRESPQPITEEALLTGPLEPTNEAYAIAKIAGLKLCQAYREQYGVLFHSVMPTNLYGPGDNYHPEHSHVIPGLIRRFCEAKKAGAECVKIWGTGEPLREFLHVDDLATACMCLLESEDPPDWINIGSGEEISIHDLAMLIAELVNYEGKIQFDSEKPSGTPRKALDSSRMRSFGWEPLTLLREGLTETCAAYLRENANPG